MNRVIPLVMILATIAGSCGAGPQQGAVKPASKEDIRNAIKGMLDARFERAAHRKSDGTIESINTMFLHVTEEDRKKVRNFGNPAVSVLREYLEDEQGWHQQGALDLLSEFRSDESFAVLVEFAERSRVREIAVTHMGQYPIDKTRPMLKKFLSDADPGVRDPAKRVLAASGQK